MPKRLPLLLSLFVAFQLLAPPSARANQYKEISAPVVKNMLEHDNAVVINVLSRLEYELHHITGSINIPFDELKQSTALPKDLGTPLIFHCMGYR